MTTSTAGCRIAATSVRGALERYPKIAALLAGAAATAIGFVVPVMALRGRLALPSLRGGDLGLIWRSGVRPPAATQQEAVDVLGSLLVGTALGTLAIAAVTILILSLVREAERSGEIAVQRAVGAARRILLPAALLEGGVIALAGLTAGAAIAALVTSGTLQWPGVVRAGAAGSSLGVVGALVIVLLAGVSIPVLFPRRRIGEIEAQRPAPLGPSALQAGASLVVLTMSGLLGRYAADVIGTRAAASVDGTVYSISMPDTAPAERAAGYAALLHALPGGEGDGAASITSPGGLLGLGRSARSPQTAANAPRAGFRSAGE